MIDSRFPNIQRLDEASALADTERARAKKIADAVCRRTQTSCAWDAKTHSLYFYYGSVDMPAFAFPFIVGRDGVAPVRESDIEDMVKLIRMGQMPLDEKEKIAEENRAKEEYDREVAREQLHADVRPEAQWHADFLLRKRRGVARTFSDSRVSHGA